MGSISRERSIETDGALKWEWTRYLFGRGSCWRNKGQMSLVWIQRRGPKQLISNWASCHQYRSAVDALLCISVNFTGVQGCRLWTASQAWSGGGWRLHIGSSDHTPLPQRAAWYRPSLRASKGRSSKSKLFSALAPRRWNVLPADIRSAHQLPQNIKNSLVQSLHSRPPPFFCQMYLL